MRLSTSFHRSYVFFKVCKIPAKGDAPLPTWQERIHYEKDDKTMSQRWSPCSTNNSEYAATVNRIKHGFGPGEGCATDRRSTATTKKHAGPDDAAQTASANVFEPL